MSDILSQFPGIISSINGPTALIALFALLVFGTAIVMFGKEGTRVKLLIFATVLAVVLMAISASIEFESTRQNPNGSNGPSANGNHEQNLGLVAGSIARPCGCWGYVNFGAQDAEPRCASGWAQAVGCQTQCPAGGFQWMIQCL